MNPLLISSTSVSMCVCIFSARFLRRRKINEMMATTADELEQYRAMDRVRSVQEAEMAKKKGLRRWNRLMAADEVRTATATPIGRFRGVFRRRFVVSSPLPSSLPRSDRVVFSCAVSGFWGHSVGHGRYPDLS